ncbi:MAG: hypothetical protein ACRBCK_02870 [Alphaproteobacteria bacterium]
MLDKKTISLTTRRLRHGCAVGAFAASALWIGTDNFGLGADDDTTAEQKPQSYSSTFDPPREHSDSLVEKCTDLSVPMLLLVAYMALRRRMQNDKMAYHEAGHTLTLIHSDPGVYQDKVWIKKNAMIASGMSEFHSLRERLSHEAARKMIMVAFAGNAAERIGCNDYITYGDSGDRAMAYDMAHKIAEQCNPPFTNKSMNLSARLAQTVENWLDKKQDIKQILSEAEQDAYRILLEHEDQLHTLAEALLEHESMTRSEVFEVLGMEDTVKDLPPTLETP